MPKNQAPSTKNQLDVLALAAHPDDVELCAGGTMCLLHRQGYKTGITDFTRGELGSRGTPEGRAEEAAAATKVMGLSARENLGIHDGNIENTEENRKKVIRVIRRYRPHIVLVNPLECRHPDHAAAARLSVDAMFYAGLRMIETFEDDGAPQEPWRPHHVLHYMQTIPFVPTFVVDVSDVWDERMKALLSFRSQFFNPGYEAHEEEPETFISNPGFVAWVEAQARTYGHRIGVTHGEPFLYRHGPFGVADLMDVFHHEKPFR
ncbi:MAG TPA: bacillithiol biosynthesis deacetylase BshB1 [Rhodothermales bacterium]|nr:bacillithiol biosynthesis deacetylase BshB1 [Rhodothermales bacterium]